MNVKCQAVIDKGSKDMCEIKPTHISKVVVDICNEPQVVHLCCKHFENMVLSTERNFGVKIRRDINE